MSDDFEEDEDPELDTLPRLSSDFVGVPPDLGDDDKIDPEEEEEELMPLDPWPLILLIPGRCFIPVPIFIFGPVLEVAAGPFIPVPIFILGPVLIGWPSDEVAGLVLLMVNFPLPEMLALKELSGPPFVEEEVLEVLP